MSPDLTKVAIGINDVILIKNLLEGQDEELREARPRDDLDLGNGAHLIYHVSSDGASIIEIRDTGVIRFWKLGNNQAVVGDRHQSPVEKYVITAKNYLMTLHQDRTIAKWNLSSERPDLFGHREQGYKYDDGVSLLAFNSQGTQLAVAADGGGVRLIDDTGKLVLDTADFHGSTEVALDGCFHPNDCILATVMNNNCIKLWDVQNRELLADIQLDRPGKGLKFNLNGDILACPNDDGKRIRLLHYTNQRYGELLKKVNVEQALFLKLILLKRAEGDGSIPAGVIQNDNNAPQAVVPQDFMNKEHLQRIRDTLDPDFRRVLRLEEFDVAAPQLQVAVQRPTLQPQAAAVSRNEMDVDSFDSKPDNITGLLPAEHANTYVFANQGLPRNIEWSQFVSSFVPNILNATCDIGFAWPLYCGLQNNDFALTDWRKAGKAAFNKKASFCWERDRDNYLIVHGAAQHNLINLMKSIFDPVFEEYRVAHNITIDSVGGKNGWTALHIACAEGYKGHLDMVKLLIELGAKGGVVSSGGSTPLHVAVRYAFNSVYGHAAVIRYLLDSIPAFRALIDAQDANGWTALHWAAYKGYRDIARILVDKGADKTKRNSSGKTACDLSADSEIRAITTCLSEAEQAALNSRMISVMRDESSTGRSSMKKLSPFSELLSRERTLTIVCQIKGIRRCIMLCNSVLFGLQNC